MVARRDAPQIARIVVVAAVSWQVCIVLGANYPPVFAVLVPLVSLRADPFSAFNLSWSRLVGVVVGLLIGVGVLRFLQPGLAAVALVLAVALLVGTVLRVAETMNVQVAVSALLVFSSPDAGTYGLTRLWETAVGTAVTALLTPFLFPANPLRAARSELSAIADDLTRAVRESVRIASSHDADNSLAVGELVGELVGIVDTLVAINTRITTLGSQIASARKSASWSVLQRGHLRQVSDLDPARALAVDIVVNLQSFAQESMTFAAREEFAVDTALQSEALRELSEPLAEAVHAALTGQAFAEPLTRAHAAIDVYRSTEHSRLAAVTRRPLHRIVEDLERFIL